MRRFFNSKLVSFLLALSGYLLFAFQWIFNYVSVWYSNIPEETQYFQKGSNMGYYMGYAYIFTVTFLIFLTLGIIYLIKKQELNFVRYALIGVLILSAFYVWHYSTEVKSYRGNAIFYFLILFLFAFSIFRLIKIEAKRKTV